MVIEHSVVERDCHLVRPIPSVPTNQNIPKKYIVLGNSVEQVVGIRYGVTNTVQMHKLGGKTSVVSHASEAEVGVKLFSGFDRSSSYTRLEERCIVNRGRIGAEFRRRREKSGID